MNRIAPWFSSCVFLSLALVAATVLAQSGQSHSALAEYEGEEGWSLGYALGHDTPAEAAAKAIEACNEGGVGNCRVAQKFSGTGCVAIAEGGDTLGYVTGGSPGQLDEMKDLAVKECQKDGESCRIVNSDCVRGHEEIVQSTVVGKDDQETGQSNIVKEESATVTTRSPGQKFRDCSDCPEMVVVPAGSFMMGSPSSEKYRRSAEGPQHRVAIRKFAVGKYEITFAEWEACRRAGGCSHNPGDEGWGKGNRPVIKISWDDAKEYVRWLSKKTGKGYRLLSESEWEYAARAGTTTPYHTGQAITSNQANYGRNHGKTVAVGTYPANQFGLHDMHGNVSEWVEDCWHDNYGGAPSNGSAWTTGCTLRVLRGGSWNYGPWGLRSAGRGRDVTAGRTFDVGFRVARVARTLTP